MNYDFVLSEIFKTEFKSLSKKYPSLKNDIIYLQSNFETELKLAFDLGGGFKKIRLNIKSKRKGKSGGARIITIETIIDISNTLVTFASIYDKSDFISIDIDVLKRNLNL